MSELESSIGPASEIFQPAEVPSVVTADTVNAEVPVAKKIRLTKAEKRAAAEERRKQYWKSKRVEEKANKKRKREEMISVIKDSGGDPRKELVSGKENETYKLKRRKAGEIDFSQQKVVVDVGFDDKMTDKEVRSLVSQLTQLYAKNRLVEHPLQIIVTDFSGRFKQNLDALEGFENWQGVKCETQGYLDLFPKERLVYLTADSEESIETLDENDIYIIGGLVDKNRLKGICLSKAREQGIRTARLPIDAYMDLKTRKVLTVNQVYEILLNWTVEKDWAKAFDAIIPKRKGGSVLANDGTTSPPNTPKGEEAQLDVKPDIEPSTTETSS